MNKTASRIAAICIVLLSLVWFFGLFVALDGLPMGTRLMIMALYLVIIFVVAWSAGLVVRQVAKLAMTYIPKMTEGSAAFIGGACAIPVGVMSVLSAGAFLPLLFGV